MISKAYLKNKIIWSTKEKPPITELAGSTGVIDTERDLC